MRKILSAFGVLAAISFLALPPRAEALPLSIGGIVVAVCGAPYTALTVGQPAYVEIEQSTGNVCTNASGGGGAGGAITAAATAFKLGAFSVGTGTDGWDSTFGSKGDTATCATANTAFSCFRQIDADINTLSGIASTPPLPYIATPRGDQQVSVTTAAGFTPPAGATFCYLMTETNAIRWRTDGTNPTTTVGNLLAPTSATAGGPQLFLAIGTLTAFKMVSVSGTATVDIDCNS